MSAHEAITDADMVALSDAVYDRLSGQFGDFNGTNADWAVEATLDALTNAGYAVVKLPEPDEIDGDGQVYFDDCDIRVDATSRQPLDIYLYGSAIVVSPNLLRRTAVARLAAAQYAEGGESGE